ALEIDLRTAGATARGGRLTKMLGHTLGEIERCRAADIVLEVAIHLAAEEGIVLRRGVRRLQLQNERHQRFGDKTAAIEPEMAALVGAGAERIELLDGHALLTTPCRARPACVRCRAPPR